MASAIGTGAAVLGLGHKIWPAHPQWALVFITIGATFVLLYIWPQPSELS